MATLRGAMETLSRDTLGLSNMQQLMLMAEAQPDKRTRCDYRKFADTITPIVQGLFSTDTLARESAIAAVGTSYADASGFWQAARRTADVQRRVGCESQPKA